ncbi:hypothetical protein DFH06DRAFT_1332997 [Mycena polygramma]|nr:hypothetical protein DFH06DRAFT_1332997 [Mycena polygramma]
MAWLAWAGVFDAAEVYGGLARLSISPDHPSASSLLDPHRRVHTGDSQGTMTFDVAPFPLVDSRVRPDGKDVRTRFLARASRDTDEGTRAGPS